MKHDWLRIYPKMPSLREPTPSYWVCSRCGSETQHPVVAEPVEGRVLDDCDEEIVRKVFEE